MDKTASCSVCGTPMWAGKDLAATPCCMPCRRTLTRQQKIALGILRSEPGPMRRQRVHFGTCAKCGEWFSSQRPVGGKYGRKFCSDACREEWRPPRPRGPQPRACRGCGNVWTPWHAGVYYCSPECKPAKQRPPAQRPCAVCGVEFDPTSSRSKYCGAACRMDAHLAKAGLGRRELYDAYLTAVRAGQVERATAWIRALTAYIAERDGTNCGICGRKVRMHYKSGSTGTKSGLGPSVDHIIPRSIAPELASDLANLRLAHWKCNRERNTSLTGTEQLALVG